jgi:hypothetical protein
VTGGPDARPPGDQPDGDGAWRGEASDPENIWTCLMAERVRGPNVHILSHST